MSALPPEDTARWYEDKVRTYGYDHRGLGFRNKSSQALFALKIINKALLKRINLEFMVKNVLNERKILLGATSPFVVRLFHSFQDEKHLYFLMEYVCAGTIASYLNKSTVFGEETIRFVVAEILLALQHLHEQMKIIYRDLKAENVLVDAEGHIKLADFGLSTSGLISRSRAGEDPLRHPGVHRARNLREEELRPSRGLLESGGFSRESWSTAWPTGSSRSATRTGFS